MAPAIPGPRGAPIVGALPQLLAAGRFEYLQACWRRYGDLYRVPLVRWPGRGDRRDDALLVTSHPDAAERILRVRHDNYYKGPNYDPIRALMGHGLVTASGDLWVRQRQLIQPAFRRGAIRDFLPTMHRCTADMLAAWERRYAGGRPFPAGSLVLFHIFNIHHHPDVWGDDPGAFDPERFTPAKVEARSRFAHMPFSGGPRVCIGKAFSIYETLLALVGVLRRFRVEYAGDGEVGLAAFATLRPAGPVLLRLRPRRD